MNRQHRPDTAQRVPCHYAQRPDLRPHCQRVAVVRYGTLAVCADCDRRRSTLGKGVRGRPTTGQHPPALRQLRAAEQAVQQARAELAAAVARARRHGHSWGEIGTTLGTTRQAAQQRFRRDRSGGG